MTYCYSEKFLKFVGRKEDIEDALQRLEKVTVEEARMVGAKVLKAVHEARNEVGGKVDGVQDTLKIVEERMRDVEVMLQDVGDILQGVDASQKSTILRRRCTARGMGERGTQVSVPVPENGGMAGTRMNALNLSYK